LACHLQINADPDPVPDPAYHLDADPDFDLMRIQITKIMRTHADPDQDADPDPQHCVSGSRLPMYRQVGIVPDEIVPYIFPAVLFEGKVVTLPMAAVESKFNQPLWL
jgi:hypothetical protein